MKLFDWFSTYAFEFVYYSSIELLNPSNPMLLFNTSSTFALRLFLEFTLGSAVLACIQSTYLFQMLCRLFLNTVECKEKYTKIIHPLSLRHVFCNSNSMICYIRIPSPFGCVTYVRRPHTQLIILRESFGNYFYWPLAYVQMTVVCSDI